MRCRMWGIKETKAVRGYWGIFRGWLRKNTSLYIPEVLF